MEVRDLSNLAIPIDHPGLPANPEAGVCTAVAGVCATGVGTLPKAEFSNVASCGFMVPFNIGQSLLRGRWR